MRKRMLRTCPTCEEMYSNRLMMCPSCDQSRGPELPDLPTPASKRDRSVPKVYAPSPFGKPQIIPKQVAPASPPRRPALEAEPKSTSFFTEYLRGRGVDTRFGPVTTFLMALVLLGPITAFAIFKAFQLILRIIAWINTVGLDGPN